MAKIYYEILGKKVRKNGTSSGIKRKVGYAFATTSVAAANKFKKKFPNQYRDVSARREDHWIK